MLISPIRGEESSNRHKITFTLRDLIIPRASSDQLPGLLVHWVLYVLLSSKYLWALDEFLFVWFFWRNIQLPWRFKLCLCKCTQLDYCSINTLIYVPILKVYYKTSDKRPHIAFHTSISTLVICFSMLIEIKYHFIHTAHLKLILGW